jgi:hypothetical protein
MASILPEKEIAGLLGVCILDGQRECLRPNGYQLCETDAGQQSSV